MKFNLFDQIKRTKSVTVMNYAVSPVILDFESSPSHITVREGARVVLNCRGDGVPLPRITWRREDGRHINFGNDRKKEGLNSTPTPKNLKNP